jgi:hypothetical protein
MLMPLFVGAVFCSAVALYQGRRDVAFLNPTVFAVMGRAGGTMLDANALGILAALWLPFACAMAMDRARERRWHAWPWTAAAVTIASGLWFSGSRSALLAAIVGLVTLVAYAVSRRSRPRDAVVATSVVAAAVVVAFVAMPATIGGPIGRLRASFGSRVNAASLVDVLWTRNGYGTAAVRMLKDHPLSGVGVGAFNTYVRDVGSWLGSMYLETDNAQNWWRHQLAELGLLGSLGLIAWTAMVGKVVFSRGDRDALVGGCTGAVLGFAAASLVGVPGQIPLVGVTFIAFVFCAAANDPRTEPAVAAPTTRTWITVVIIVVAFLTATTRVALTDMRPPLRPLKTGWPYHYGFYQVEGPAGAQFRWTTSKAVNVVPIEGPWLKLAILGGVPPDAEQHPIEVKVWRDRSLILRLRRRDSSPTTRYVRMHDGARWVMLQIETDRTWRPSNSGSTDTRALGVAVEPWSWVKAPPPDGIRIE